MRNRGWRENIYKMAESKLEEGERYRELLKKISKELLLKLSFLLLQIILWWT